MPYFRALTVSAPANPIFDEFQRGQVALKLIDGWLCGLSGELGREQVALKLTAAGCVVFPVSLAAGRSRSS